MPFPKLTPLQSRLFASLFASAMLLTLYLLFSLPSFAYAGNVDSIRPEDHNHERLLEFPLLDDFDELDLDLGDTYEAEFFGVDRSIIGRATTTPTALINNRIETTNIQLGQLFSYSFKNASLWGVKSPVTPGLPSQITLQGRNVGNTQERDQTREGELETELRARQVDTSTNRTLYITVTTCDQPLSNVTGTPAPQLQLYVSQSQNNTNPGPGQPANLQDMVQLEGGYVLYQLNATGDVFMGVYAQNATEFSKGVYSAQIAASIDAPYHTYHNSPDPNLFLVDSDNLSALLYTDPFVANTTNTTLVEEWMNQSPPFVVFASDANNSAILGVERSYCGLKTKAQIQASVPGQTAANIVTGMTTRGVGALPRQEFYMDGLGAGKSYSVVLAMNGNSTAAGNFVVGGGGQVFNVTSFETLQDGNCEVIYDLSFCDQIAYSVPSNPNNFPNMSALASFYDNSTQASFANFEKVLAQIPCETTPSAQYSLARTCTDCREAYKSWLCAVSIPRCTDFTSSKDWLIRRAMGQPFPNGTLLPERDRVIANQTAGINASRNAAIDATVMPGPYKEVLPCDELCFELVRSCPAVMGFGCPQQGDIGFNESYGTKPLPGVGDPNGMILGYTCNSPGTIYFASEGGRVLPEMLGLSLLVVGMIFI